MTALLALILSTCAYAEAGDEVSKPTISVRPTAKPSPDWPWTIGVQECPQDLLDSIAYVHGTVGEADEEESDEPMSPASVHSRAYSAGSTDDFVWEKRSEVGHQADWDFDVLDTGGGSWSYTSTAGHEAETTLYVVGCEPDGDIACMADVQADGASGLTSSSGEGEAGSAGAGGSPGGSGTEGGDAEHHPAYLVVDERTSFELVVSFRAEVDVDPSGEAGGGHTSSFGVILTNHATGAVVLDRRARPVQHSWSLSNDQSDSKKGLGRSYITLEPGEYALSMSVTDQTWSWAVSDSSIATSSVDVSSRVRSTVELKPR